MISCTPNKILDDTLDFIYNNYVIDKENPLSFVFTQETIREGLNKHLSNKYDQGIGIEILDKLEMKEIIYKLVKDGYLEESLENAGCFTTTFEGRWFSQKGYVAEAEFLSQEIKWRKYIEKKTVDSGKLLNRYTLILAIGTIGLLLFEIYRYYHCLCL